MKLIAVLLAALVASSMALTANELEKLPQEEYTARALAELKAMSKSRFLSEIQSPTCEIYWEQNAIECSLKFKWMKVPRVVSVQLQFNLKRLQLYFALLFDGDVLLEHKIDLAKLCIPLPGLLKQIEICLHAYYVDIDTKPPALSFDACFLITLGPFLHLRLNCVRLDKQGKFSHHAKFQPEDEGIIVLSIENGNLKFKLNNPIPKEVWDQIEKGWKEFEKGAKATFDKAGKELHKFGKNVEQGFNKFGKDVEKGWNQAGQEVNKFGKNVEQGFNKFGKDVEKGWNQAGQELNKFGKNVEQGFNKFGQDTKKAFDDIGQKFKNFFG